MARAKLQRWVDLLAALLRRNYPAPFEEIAGDVPAYGTGRRTEAVRRMFERDKDELRSAGIPIETRDIGDGELGYALPRANFYLPYLTLIRDGRPSKPARPGRYGYRSLPSLAFEPDELAAIAAAAHRVRALKVASLDIDVQSALRKLGHDLPVEAVAAESERIHLAGPGRAEAATFGLLSDALRSKKRVTFSYHSMGRDTSAARTVEPYGLFFLGRHWYLAGPADGDPTLKNFRLDRISAASVNAAQPGTPDYTIPRGFKLKEHARSREAWELGHGDVMEARVRVVRRTGSASALTRLGHPVSEDASLRRFQIRRMDAFVRWLMGFGGAALPVEPPELVAQFRRSVAETLAVYDPGSPA